MCDEIPNDLTIKDPFVFVKGCKWSHDAFVYKFSMETSCQAVNRLCCTVFITECNPLNFVDEHIAEKRGFYPYCRDKGDKYWTVKPQFVDKLIELAIVYWEKYGYTVYNKNNVKNMRVYAYVDYDKKTLNLCVEDQDFDNVDAANESDEDKSGGWGTF